MARPFNCAQRSAAPCQFPSLPLGELPYCSRRALGETDDTSRSSVSIPSVSCLINNSTAPSSVERLANPESGSGIALRLEEGWSYDATLVLCDQCFFTIQFNPT